MAELEIPDGARKAGDQTVRSLRRMGIGNFVPDVLRTAGPPLVAAELDRIAASITPDPDPGDEEGLQEAYDAGRLNVAEMLRRRAAELRGEQP